MKYLTGAVVRLQTTIRDTTSPAQGEATEDGFEVAQSMGIALLGLVIAAAFAGLLQVVGNDIIAEIRAQLGL